MVHREQPRLLLLASSLALLTGLCAQVRVQLGPVPYTMQNYGIALAGYLLPPRYAALSQILYLLLILCGAPLAAGLRGGVGVLLSWTSGYLLMFPVMAYLTSHLTRLLLRNPLEESRRGVVVRVLTASLAEVPLLLTGWLTFLLYTVGNPGLVTWCQRVGTLLGVSGSLYVVTFVTCVLIFLPQDILIDHLLAAVTAPQVARVLRKWGLLS